VGIIVTIQDDFPLIIYIALIALSLFLPFISPLLSKKYVTEFKVNLSLTLLFFAIAIVCFNSKTFHITAPLILSFAILPLAALSGLWSTAVSLAVFVIFATTTWWAPELRLTPIRSSAFLSFGFAAVAICFFYRSGKGAPKGWVFTIVVILGVLANSFAGPLSAPVGLGTFWHHWSVFIAPAQTLVAGGVPFIDFPIQYGFGPMILMATGCLWECWSGAHAIIALCNLIFLLSMTGSAILLLQGTARGLAICALVALTVSILMWTTYPPDLLGVLATPSTGGIRFVPLSLLLLFILNKETTEARRDWPGHILWIAGIIWSPEAAYFVTLVWWPYLALRDIDKRSITKLLDISGAVLVWAAKSVCSLSLVVIVSAIIFRFLFGQWPSLDGYLAYVKNPPGVLPVNEHGPIWIILSSLVVGFTLIFVSESSNRRILMVLINALVAVSAYYLSRSHDNNVLNLFPFVVLLLIGMLRLDLPAACESFGKMMLVAVVLWSATFGLHAWSSAWQAGTASKFGMAEIFDKINIASPSSWPAADAARAMLAPNSPPISDAGRALSALFPTGDGSPVLISGMMVLPRQAPARAWTTMTNVANYAPLPPDAIKTFIQRGAQRFERPGWIIVDRANPGLWLDLFKSAYDVSEQRQFGGYDAYRLVPR
jgi:hypothetical protein